MRVLITDFLAESDFEREVLPGVEVDALLSLIGHPPTPCAGYLGHLFIKIGDLCQEKRERARLCSMNMQVAIWATKQKDNAFSLSVEGKQDREYNNAQ